MENNILYIPQVRAISTMISTFGSGILCGAVVTDITVNGKLVWRNIFSSEMALITLIFFILLTAYYIGMYNTDVTNDAVLQNYQDVNVLIAMVRKGQMKHLIKKSKQEIKKGNYSELATIDEILKGEYQNGQHRNNKSGKTKDTTAT